MRVRKSFERTRYVGLSTLRIRRTLCEGQPKVMPKVETSGSRETVVKEALLTSKRRRGGTTTTRTTRGEGRAPRTRSYQPPPPLALFLQVARFPPRGGRRTDMTNRRCSSRLKFSPGASTTTVRRVIYSGLLERTIKKKKKERKRKGGANRAARSFSERESHRV